MTKRKNEPTSDDSPAEAFLNVATEYYAAANALYDVGGHHRLPIYFLYTHTIELAFKAFLRSWGETATKIHLLEVLCEKCRLHGFRVNSDLKNVVGLLQTENKFHGFRYYAFKSTSIPEISYLRQVVDDLIVTVTEEVQRRPTKDFNEGVIKFIVGKPVST